MIFVRKFLDMRAFLRDRRGVTAIEFAMIGLPFIALLVVMFEIGIVCFAQQELETAVEQSARIVLTGQTKNVSQAQFSNKVCGYLPALFTCSGIMIDLQSATNFASANTSTPTLTYDADGKVTNTWTYNTGTKGDVMVLRVLYQFPIWPGPLAFNLPNLANGKRLLIATAVFQNEPY